MDSSHSHSTLRMSSLALRLPEDVFPVLLSFLDKKDLLNFDSALTDRFVRELYLGSLCKLPIRHLLEEELPYKTKWERFLLWHRFRGVAVFPGVATKTIILPYYADDDTITLVSEPSAALVYVEEVTYDHPNGVCMITDTGMAALAHIPNLKVLCLRRIPKKLTGSSLYPIVDLPIEELDLHGCRGITRRGMARIAALHFLRKLDISSWGLPGFTAYVAGALEVLAKSKTLQSLTVSLFGVSDDELRVFSNPAAPLAKSLVELFIDSIDEITNEGIAHLVRGFKNLRSLYISDSSIDCSVTSACLEYIAEHLPHLKKLTLHLRNLSDDHLKFLRRMKRLISLDVCGVGDFTGSGLAFLRGIPTLRKVSVCSDAFTAEGLDSLKHLHKITKFSVYTYEGALTDEMMAQIRYLTALKHLIWHHDGEITDDDQDKGITDESLAALSELKHLEVLELGFCRKITAQGLLRLAKACKSLTHITIAPYLGSRRRRNLATMLGGLNVSVSFN